MASSRRFEMKVMGLPGSITLEPGVDHRITLDFEILNPPRGVNVQGLALQVTLNNVVVCEEDVDVFDENGICQGIDLDVAADAEGELVIKAKATGGNLRKDLVMEPKTLRVNRSTNPNPSAQPAPSSSSDLSVHLRVRPEVPARQGREHVENVSVQLRGAIPQDLTEVHTCYASADAMQGIAQDPTQGLFDTAPFARLPVSIPDHVEGNVDLQVNVWDGTQWVDQTCSFRVIRVDAAGDPIAARASPAPKVPDPPRFSNGTLTIVVAPQVEVEGDQDASVPFRIVYAGPDKDRLQDETVIVEPVIPHPHIRPKGLGLNSAGVVEGELRLSGAVQSGTIEFHARFANHAVCSEPAATELVRKPEADIEVFDPDDLEIEGDQFSDGFGLFDADDLEPSGDVLPDGDMCDLDTGEFRAADLGDEEDDEPTTTQLPDRARITLFTNDDHDPDNGSWDFYVEIRDASTGALLIEPLVQVEIRDAAGRGTRWRLDQEDQFRTTLVSGDITILLDEDRWPHLTFPQFELVVDPTMLVFGWSGERLDCGVHARDVPKAEQAGRAARGVSRWFGGLGRGLGRLAGTLVKETPQPGALVTNPGGAPSGPSVLDRLSGQLSTSDAGRQRRADEDARVAAAIKEREEAARRLELERAKAAAAAKAKAKSGSSGGSGGGGSSSNSSGSGNATS